MRDDRRLNLNPAGRQQTKKHRPIVPVNDLLHEWLSETDEWFVCKERISFDPHDQAPIVEQIGVKAVRSGWDSMRQSLNIPDGWGPKLIRHSMSSELRKRRVDPWELSGQLGHRVLKTSETYAIYDPDYLGTVQMGIKEVLADLEKACGSSIHPTFPRQRPTLDKKKPGYLVEYAGFFMVGVARIELATPAMSTQSLCSNTTVFCGIFIRRPGNRLKTCPRLR